MTAVEAALAVYWTSPLPLAVLLALGASLATLFFVFLANAPNAKLRVSLLTALYGLSTFFWIFLAASFVLCVVQRDAITYATAGVQVAAATAIAVALAGSVILGTYVWHRAPLRLLGRLGLRRPREDEEWVQGYVDLLAAYEGIPSPRVLLRDVPRPECFAVGAPREDVIVVSRGLLDVLDPDELRAAVAHEFVHIRNRDARFKVYSAVMSRVLFFDPFSKLLDPAVHREREYLADETGARLHGRPASLASALLKLDEHGPPTAGYGVLGIVGPARGVFSRYPPLPERIRRLLLLSTLLASR